MKKMLFFLTKVGLALTLGESFSDRKLNYPVIERMAGFFQDRHAINKNKLSKNNVPVILTP